MARTMLRRKRSAVITNVMPRPPGVGIHSARVTRQMLVLASVWSLENDVKSEVRSRMAAARFMAS